MKEVVRVKYCELERHYNIDLNAALYIYDALLNGNNKTVSFEAVDHDGITSPATTFCCRHSTAKWQFSRNIAKKTQHEHWLANRH
jgi:hypothetical protein